MSVLIAVGWIAPPLLILWRSRREPKWVAYVRYGLAMLVVWQVVITVISHDTLIRVRETRAQGDIEGALADTGSNAAAVIIGWIPGVIYSLLLGAGRRFCLWFREKRAHQAVT